MRILAALALIAAPAAAEPAPQRVDPALVKRFIEVLPTHFEAGPALIKPDPELARKYDDLNPERTGEVLPILEAHTDCLASDRRPGGIRVIRVLADRLGDENLRGLIAFHESRDAIHLDVLRMQEEEGATLSPEDQADVERIYARYPIAEYERLALDIPRIEAADAVSHARRTACLATAIAAMRRAKLKVE